MSDTPRTDAHNWNEGDYDDPLDSMADFAMQLERELNAANERIKWLEDAGDLMVQHFYTDEPRSEMWEKAKEAKP